MKGWECTHPFVAALHRVRQLLRAAGIEASRPGALQPRLQAADVGDVAAPAEENFFVRLRGTASKTPGVPACQSISGSTSGSM